MKTPLKMATLLMALMFAVQGCALYISDRDHHRHFRHRWHSSVEQSPQPMTHDLQAKNVIDRPQMDQGTAD